MDILKSGLETILIDGPMNKINESKLQKINHGIKSGKHVFLFLFMNKCGPCNMTKPSWANIQKHLKKEHLNNSKIILAQINKDHYGQLRNIGKEPIGFPTLRYISDKEIQEYEDASLKRKDRSPESFAEWINIKVTPIKSHNFNPLMIRQNGGKGTRYHNIAKYNCNVARQPKRRAGGGTKKIRITKTKTKTKTKTTTKKTKKLEKSKKLRKI